MKYTVSGYDLTTLSLNEIDRVQSILQGVALILTTQYGTVPMYREYGIKTEFKDKPIPIAQSLLAAEIVDAVERFEPRVSVTDVSFSQSDEIGTLYPIVEVEILEEEEMDIE